jgi:GT2 family glycosyltransferase
MEKNNTTVSIVIVNYKTPQLLKACVQSIIDTTNHLSYEIIVVDNNSEDESEQLIVEHFPDVTWINSGYNAGFARANNMGIKVAAGTYIFLLNPDALLVDAYLLKMVKYHEELSKTHRVGLVTSRILSSIDQSLLIGTGIHFKGIDNEVGKNPFMLKFHNVFKARQNKAKYDPYTMHYVNHEVDFVSGACALIKRETLADFNLFLDEDFFLYWEDVEWSYRIKKNGLKNFFFADTEIYHVNSASTGKSNHRNAQVRISEFLYYRKRYNHLKFHVLGLLIRFNYFLNAFLLKRSKNAKALEELKFDKLLFNQYFYRVNTQYKGNKTKVRPYLKYGEENRK